jgi:hypothetical protein
MSYKIAAIVPDRNDYLTGTILDGLLWLNKENVVDFGISSKVFGVGPYKRFNLGRDDFKKFAATSDFILLFWGKSATNLRLAEEINCWRKTFFLDGSELGKNRRYDRYIQSKVLNKEWECNGKIDTEMLRKCALYFRREKPYIDGIIPLPFGIESKYLKYYSSDVNKDIDFVCIFGQEDFPPMRREVRETLEKYCRDNDLVCYTNRTASQEEFYKLLARAKAGVSVGGGGFDTTRFWEILGNNCLLLTEAIDIYEPDSNALKYNRIFEFKDMDSFNSQLEKISVLLRSNYPPIDYMQEYRDILQRHSSKARVMTIINAAKAKKNNMGEMENGQCSVVVSSCDAFEDVWKPFFTLFFRYWPDCPFPVYLISSTKKYEDNRVKNISLGDDSKWATNLRRALAKISSPYILYLQEDYFLEKKVETRTILQFLNFVKENSAAYLRLVPSPGPDVKIKSNDLVGEISKSAAYRTSLQAAIWDKKILLSLIKDGERGWDMEINGTIRSRTIANPFFCVTKVVLPYFNKTAIKKGRWFYDAVKLCQKEGVDLNSQRPVEPYQDFIFRRLRSLPILGGIVKVIAKIFSKIYGR